MWRRVLWLETAHLAKSIHVTSIPGRSAVWQADWLCCHCEPSPCLAGNRERARTFSPTRLSDASQRSCCAGHLCRFHLPSTPHIRISALHCSLRVSRARHLSCCAIVLGRLTTSPPLISTPSSASQLHCCRRRHGGEFGQLRHADKRGVARRQPHPSAAPSARI